MDIHNVDDYNSPPRIHEFTDVLFRTGISTFHNFITPICVHDGKILSVSNKIYSFLPKKMGHNIDQSYMNELQITKNEINATNVEVISEPIFYFLDYEAVNGTGHSYDIMCYLLYHYKKNNLNCNLLVMNSDNVYYNKTLDLLKTWTGLTFTYVDFNKNYLIKNFKCIQTYQNILFPEVKEFLNENIIKPIISKYESLNFPFYKNICKVKYNNKDQINKGSAPSDAFKKFLNDYHIKDIEDCSEEYKIYLLNKADNVIVSWGSTYYINCNYYMLNNDKYICVLFYKHYAPERQFLGSDGNTIQQFMHDKYSGGIHNNVFSTFISRGCIIDDVDNLDDIIHKVKDKLQLD
mgnify:CR=1 FL=1